MNIFPFLIFMYDILKVLVAAGAFMNIIDVPFS